MMSVNKALDKITNATVKIIEIGLGKYTEKPDPNLKGKAKFKAKTAELLGWYQFKESYKKGLVEPVASATHATAAVFNTMKSLSERKKYRSSYEIECLKYGVSESDIKNQYVCSSIGALTSLFIAISIVCISAYNFGTGDYWSGLKYLFYSLIIPFPLYCSYTIIAYQHNMRDKFEGNVKGRLGCFKSLETAIPFPSDFKTKK